MVVGIHKGVDSKGEAISFVNFLSPEMLRSCKAAADSYGGIVPAIVDGKQKVRVSERAERQRRGLRRMQLCR